VLGDEAEAQFTVVESIVSGRGLPSHDVRGKDVVLRLRRRVDAAGEAGGLICTVITPTGQSVIGVPLVTAIGDPTRLLGNADKHRSVWLTYEVVFPDSFAGGPPLEEGDYEARWSFVPHGGGSVPLLSDRFSWPPMQADTS
jgi:hypothetical protein